MGGSVSLGVMLAEIRRIMVLAGVLVALAFVFDSPAQAAMPVLDHAGHHHAQPTTDHAVHKAASAHQHQKDGGVHHGGNCHCVSAACASVLPPQVISYGALMSRWRHDHPPSWDARALAGVAPAAEPPRL